MISKDKYELVKNAIQVHNKLKDRTYLILYKASAKQISKHMITPILEENFWHLVGCKIDDKIELSPEQKHHMYLKCVNGEDISDSLEYTRQPQDVSKKVNITRDSNDKIFLIISKPYGSAKYYRVDYAISKKIFPDIIDEIPDGTLYEEHLFDSK